MANVLVQESVLQNIADAIRLKNGSESLYKPSQMAEAIEDLSSGTITITSNGSYDVGNYDNAEVSVSGGATLGTKTITVNGVYSAEDDDLDGYSSVDVHVNAGSYPFYVENGYFGEAKWQITNAIPQIFANGGCFELLNDFTDYSYQSTSGIKLFSFGGTINNWSPSSNDHIVFNSYSTGATNIIFRGSINDTITVHPNSSNILHFKMYKDRIILLDGTTSASAVNDVIELTGNALTIMTNVSNLSAISIGCNEGSNANNYYKARINRIAFLES